MASCDVQTPVQRRANAKFAKENEGRMGKSTEQLKKRSKETPKSPISPLWMVILGFAIFGSLIFELISRFFFR
ncbi:related to secretory pathway protein YSY6 [Cephalotrichum gorgonifer]|uniref:Stress-associated endoplasmic reticulum protein n=1 Tax=Cephalotrichum gorgonifer TaxID=2041049 RepID=A0AAE8SUA9_9PEZI|nr:related to secretory pathway protein YSY6 [Cephalotrichum gorgonifer]